MSDKSQSSKPAPGFFWFLSVLLGFAVAAAWLTSGAAPRPNPRDEVRAKEAAEVKALQEANLQKMGLMKGKSTERLAKSVDLLKAMPAPAASSVVVPGSPTQLKQAPAPAPAAAPATPPSK